MVPKLVYLMEPFCSQFFGWIYHDIPLALQRSKAECFSSRTGKRTRCSNCWGLACTRGAASLRSLGGHLVMEFGNLILACKPMPIQKNTPDSGIRI